VPIALQILVREEARRYGIPHDVLTDRAVRRLDISQVRQNVMWSARTAGFSLHQIGRALGGLDHTTVKHGLKRVGEDIAAGRARPCPEDYDSARDDDSAAELLAELRERAAHALDLQIDPALVRTAIEAASVRLEDLIGEELAASEGAL
jgi:hypothetical protein